MGASAPRMTMANSSRMAARKTSQMTASDLQKDETPDWKAHGLRIIRNGELDTNTPQTPG
jgi:hypothetical protein